MLSCGQDVRRRFRFGFGFGFGFGSCKLLMFMDIRGSNFDMVTSYHYYSGCIRSLPHFCTLFSFLFLFWK
jgi:hypothetical protein